MYEEKFIFIAFDGSSVFGCMCWINDEVAKNFTVTVSLTADGGITLSILMIWK